MRANTYDPEADAAYIYLADATVAESEEVADGVVLDFDDGGRVVGIEVLNASRTLRDGVWRRWPLPGGDAHVHAAE
jgi:uncharacterized protein YuzE